MPTTHSSTSHKTSARKASPSRTSAKSTAKAGSKSTAKRTSAAKDDAVKLLIAAHKEVKALFKDYNKLAEDGGPANQRQALAQKICLLLKVHTSIEEEIFYPVAREAIDDDDLLDEATVEHASAKDLIKQIESMSPSEDLYDAKVKVLGEYIEHHVKEEETELFPEVKKAKADLAELGADMATRKQALLSEMGVDSLA